MICRTWYSAVRSRDEHALGDVAVAEPRRDQFSDVKLAAGKSCRYPAIHLGEFVLGEPGVANRPDPPEYLAGRVQFEAGRVKVALGPATPGEQRPGPGRFVWRVDVHPQVERRHQRAAGARAPAAPATPPRGQSPLRPR